MPNLARTWVEISGSAIRHNLQVVQGLVGPGTSLSPVVKANAYGHGMLEVAQSLKNAKIWGLSVAYGSEALALIQAGFRGKILVLTYWEPAELPMLARHGVHIAIYDFTTLAMARSYEQRTGKQVHVHLKLDTGTSRIGFLPTDIRRLHNIMLQRRFDLSGIFSHLANAEEPTPSRTIEQLGQFDNMRQTLGLSAAVTHIACTAAIVRYPSSRYTMARLGLGLYGLWPSPATRAARRPSARGDLRPALEWKSVLAQVKTVPAGTGIGYGSTVTVKKKTVVGTVPVGYADGYDRSLSNRGWVMVGGQQAPVLGRVCMNMFMVNLNRLKKPRPGQQVTLLGPGYTADDMAAHASTISYEVISRISPLIPRQRV